MGTSMEAEKPVLLSTQAFEAYLVHLHRGKFSLNFEWCVALGDNTPYIENYEVLNNLVVTTKLFGIFFNYRTTIQ